MPRKKKIAEADTAQVPAVKVQSPDTTPASEARLDQQAEHRMQAESPAPARDAEAEMEAQAADTFEEAFDSEPLGDAIEDLARNETTKKTAAKKPKAARKPRKAKEATKGESGKADAAEVEVRADSAGSVGEVETPAVIPSESVPVDADGGTSEFTAEPRLPVKLERLQKILSQAGVASRRHAEELITQGRVQVNGTVVTALGSKADPERDHIRVDGKLLRGAERLRYFVLNKPRGYVTTVSDPEGRPTVMEFFAKTGERLYPVGRLDYQSEGLLLVTNDGDLANKLTKAASGVEKTYLVKVSGRPTEEELDQLRGGVRIDRGKPGEGRVTTSPAAIRQVRPGENPWYEVVLIEGRNRELRKMFEEIGHHVEKIRRVGYGPLVLDQEPGKFRELEADELSQLRLASEGKWRRPKTPEPQRGRGGDRGGRVDRPEGRRRDAGFERKPERQQLPGRFAEGRPPRRSGDWERRPPNRQQPEWKRGERPARPPRPFNEGEGSEGRRAFGSKPQAFGRRKPPAGFERAGERGSRPAGSGPARPRREGADRPAWERSAPRDREFRAGRRESRETRERFDRFRDEGDKTDRGRTRATGARPPRAGQVRGGEGRVERPRSERSDEGRQGAFGRSKPRPQGGFGARPGQKPDWKKRSGPTGRPAPDGRSRPLSKSDGPSNSGGRGPAGRTGRGRTGPGRGGDHRGGRGKSRY
jgi:23S rRNA pseudouridine2605 synthase